MSEIFQELGRKLIFPIDFHSQQRTERYQQIILMLGSFLACVVGFVSQSALYTVLVYGLAVLVAMVTVLPPYPHYTREKLEWVKPQINI